MYLFFIREQMNKLFKSFFKLRNIFKFDLLRIFQTISW